MLARARLNWQRRKLAGRSLHPGLTEYLNAPLPAASTLWREVRFVALDIETTGLDPASAEMLSVGWVPIENGAVQLSGARSRLIRPQGNVGQSATVHGLTDTRMREGEPLERVFLALLADLQSSILIVHHATLDIGMLKRASRDVAGSVLPLPIVDTLAMHKQKVLREHGVIGPNTLRLAAVRESYGLPEYAAHECLGDAIATAEVFVAMIHHRFGDRGTTLRDVWG